jgi:plasmid stability protein
MAQLIVRDIEEKVVRKLKQRAGEHGISMEEEHRRILRDALFSATATKLSFKEHLKSMPEIPEECLQRPKDMDRDIDL